MSRFINVNVEAKLSTEFMIEVDDDATEEDIKDLAKEEVKLPTDYPKIIDNALKKMGVMINGLDSLLKSWNIDNINYKIDGIE